MWLMCAQAEAGGSPRDSSLQFQPPRGPGLRTWKRWPRSGGLGCCSLLAGREMHAPVKWGRASEERGWGGQADPPLTQ